jgi:hypothetical protein
MSQQPPNYPPNNQPPYQGGPYQPQGQWQGQQPPPGYQYPPQQPGYYPGPPQQPPRPPKKGVPVWAWVVGGFVGLLIIAGIVGAASKSNTAIATPTALVAAQPTTNIATARATPTSVFANDPTVQAVAKSTPTERATATPRATPTEKATATPPPAPTPLAGVNQVVSIKNWNLKVLGTEKPGKTITWTEFGNTVDAVGTWLIIPVELKNTGNANFGVHTFDFQLKDGKGVTYDHSSELGAFAYSKFKGGQDVGGQVPPGLTVKYYLVFDIAPDANGLKLVFRQDKNPQINLGI